MKASSTVPSNATPMGDGLRLQLSDSAAHVGVDGAWWPRSRDLQREAADLVDHFPTARGRIQRLLFSRPDWDGSGTDGRGVRTILSARGRVKVGSFPSDDTHLMVLSLASGLRLKVLVIPSATPAAEAQQLLSDAAAGGRTPEGAVDWARWDNESPGR